MKNSGIEWIGEIPDDWFFIRSKYVAYTYTGNSIKDEEKMYFEDSTNAIPYIATKNINSTTSLIDKTDILFIKQNDSRFVKALIGDTLMCIEGGSAGKKKTYLQEKVCFVNKLCCFHPIKINGKFLYYLLQSPHYESEFNLNITGLIGGVSRSKLDNFVLPYPSAIIQQKIADYLDKKCAAVDRLIENQREQIEKLKEYKQSVITEAVTRGLDPSAPLKDSGVEWLGKIPAGWDIIRGKNVLTLLIKPVLQTDNVITCFRDGEVTLRSNRREEGFTFSEKEIGYQGVDVGDLVVHGMDGFAGAIGISDSRGKASPVLIVLNTTQNKRYLMFYLRSIAYRNIFLALSTGIRVRSCDLRWNKLSALPFLVPSLKEQDEIVAYIDRKLQEIDKLISIKQQKIETLTEYKKSLIYEYVTGKKQVG